MKRIIFLGLDGQNPEFVEKYLDHLPNFRRLISTGCWGPLLSTFPADTPTNWTALATGARASKSGITGFAFHKPGTSLKSRIFGPAAFVDFRNAEFIWEAAADQGKKTILINYPFGWHSRESENTIIVGGDTISGGIPEIVDCSCFCSADRAQDIEDGKFCDLTPGRNGYEGDIVLSSGFRYEWTATGVERVKDESSPDALLRFHVKTDENELSVFTPDGAEVVRLKPGDWSDYFSVPFQSKKACLRFFLADLGSDGKSFILFHSPLTWDQGWTKPASLAAELCAKVGPYQQAVETKGNLFTKGWFGRYALEANLRLLSDCGKLFADYTRIIAKEYPDWSMLYSQLHSTDGMNHKRLCQIDPDCPLSNAEIAAETDRWFLELYKATDVILGRFLALADEYGAAIVVASDHSAIPTHTWVDTARPFVEREMLFFGEDGIWDESRSTICKKINHSIYINLKGRQPDGVAEPSEYETLRDEIILALLSMRDPRTGDCPIAVAARREDMDAIGANSENFGDVVYLMRPGYTNQPASEYELLTEERLSTFVADPQKGLREGYCFHRSIQGNHHDYMPNAAYGEVCTNRGVVLLHGPGIGTGVSLRNAATIDVTPTICAYIGIEPPADVEGKILPGALTVEA